MGRKRKRRLDKVGSADKKAFRIQVDAYPRYAASALATNALVRCSFAGKSRVKMDPGVCVVFAALELSVCVLVILAQQRPGHASAALPSG